MRDLLEQIVVRCANRLLRSRERRPAAGPSVLLGHGTTDNGTLGAPVRLPDARRAEHVAILGKTGSGKTSLIRVMALDDIRRNHGFVVIDLHGDTTPFLLSSIAAEEERRGADLSGRVLLIDPSDPEWAFGLNILTAASDSERFVQVAEVAQLLKARWDLNSFGPRTDELLRNALFALSAAGLTLVELPTLLSDAAFRTACMQAVTNEDVCAFFRERFDAATEAMQAVLRDAVLNKVTTFTADPHFRHVLGQTQTGISVTDALDRGCWIILNLPKGRLGEQAATLGSLFLTTLRRALFARRSRTLVTVYADELQNLVDYSAGIDLLLAEARKFAVGFCTSNQYLAQYSPAIRAAVLAVGTHVFFQLASQDAEQAHGVIGGSKAVSQTLKELPHRHAIINRGANWQQFRVETVPPATAAFDDLVARVHGRWARRRIDVEREIQQRRLRTATPARGELDGWE